MNRTTFCPGYSLLSIPAWSRAHLPLPYTGGIRKASFHPFLRSEPEKAQSSPLPLASREAPAPSLDHPETESSKAILTRAGGLSSPCLLLLARSEVWCQNGRFSQKIKLGNLNHFRIYIKRTGLEIEITLSKIMCCNFLGNLPSSQGNYIDSELPIRETTVGWAAICLFWGLLCDAVSGLTRASTSPRAFVLGLRPWWKNYRHNTSLTTDSQMYIFFVWEPVWGFFCAGS